MISGILLIAPYVHDRTLTLLPKLVSIGYPMGDIILLAAGIRLAVDAGKRRPAFYLLIASIVTLLATDFVYGLFTLHNAYTHQLWMDAGWIFFYLLWAAAALHPSMVELSEVEADRQPRLTWLRLALLAGASLTAPALEIFKVAPTHNWDLLFVIGASALLFALVVGAHDRARAPAREVGLARTRTQRGGWTARRRNRAAGDHRGRAPGGRRLRRQRGRCARVPRGARPRCRDGARRSGRAHGVGGLGRDLRAARGSAATVAFRCLRSPLATSCGCPPAAKGSCSSSCVPPVRRTRA